MNLIQKRIVLKMWNSIAEFPIWLQLFVCKIADWGHFCGMGKDRATDVELPSCFSVKVNCKTHTHTHNSDFAQVTMDLWLQVLVPVYLICNFR